MTSRHEIRWVTPLAQALEMAQSQWDRTVHKVSEHFHRWCKSFPVGAFRQWMVYSGSLGQDHMAAKYVWNQRESKRSGRSEPRGTPYQQQQQRAAKKKS
jgi:hypothetical protein